MALRAMHANEYYMISCLAPLLVPPWMFLATRSIDNHDFRISPNCSPLFTSWMFLACAIVDPHFVTIAPMVDVSCSCHC